MNVVLLHELMRRIHTFIKCNVILLNYSLYAMRNVKIFI